jgi:NTE family protein
LQGLLRDNLYDFIHAAAVIGLFATGFIIAFNVSALVNWIFVHFQLKPLHYRSGPPQELTDNGGYSNSPLVGVERIGIVLAGGGAKGAYQAGAMKAIYQVLGQYGALEKVKVIASTSIGSWNALFWLANLIMPEGDWGGEGIHESWWRSITAKSLVAPSWYFPCLRNSFLSSEPWQQVFDQLFGRSDVRDQLIKTHVHFYMTRSNVGSGELECVTNNPNPPHLARLRYHIADPTRGPEEFLQTVKFGVFASMDLPPLFPYMKNDDRVYEDGGVIDNLPITFAALQQCDLIFVLPLNADFEEEPSQRSVIARLLRVMDVRQGALERNGFKLLYLYNELAALREFIDSRMATSLDQEMSEPRHNRISEAKPLARALARQNKHINVFAVCPQRSFVQSTIDTQELWKTKDAGIAFNVMHRATTQLLSKFSVDHPQAVVRVALVSRYGNVLWDENF